ncbi:hypothetical protein PHMEG_00021903 [Phytophthora megakarya]|uniref:Bzip transcription factor n=1 Tax=Phytophthora megakarya TaxID=4795 RepID=A0A225VKR1_9STRA|nr:hypothetical protein PHMEG_00021903 [Phytophthora megakarya]
MDCQVRHPPNKVLLSNKTIGDVKPRAWQHRRNYVEQDEKDAIASSELQSRRIDSKRKTFPASSALELQRKIRRKYQARYREKQLRTRLALEDDVQRLQMEIKELDYQRLCAPTFIPVEPNVWVIALEYFRIFRHGFKEASLEQSVLAHGFLQKSMAPDVSDGNLQGPKALMQNWELFSSYFDDIHVELKSMRNITEDTLLATTTTSVSISSHTLRSLFPHMNSDGYGGVYGGTWSPLAKQLEGQRLVMQGSVRFYWDSVTNRVVQIRSWSDMLTAILRAVGNLEDVSCVFNGALVTPDCTLR